MPPKVNKSYRQPKIQGYTSKLRSRVNSAPGGQAMADIFEDDEFSSCEELGEDANLKDIISKMNEVCRKVERIEKLLLNEDTGLKHRFPAVELKAETVNGKVLAISKEYKAIKQDLNTI